MKSSKDSILENQKAAIYIRVSTQWQVDKDSLQVQRRELIAYSQIVLGIQDFFVFEDPGYSAKNTDRPDYQAMMDRIRTGEFSHLLVWKIDRISRNLLDFATMYAELKSIGVTFVSKNEQFDTSTAIGEAMLKIILIFAELERKMTAERVSAVMLSRANEGKWNGGKVPYGYKWDKKSKAFSPDEYESKILHRIWDLYEDSQSVSQVCRSLNESGFTTRLGNKWSIQTVYKMLSNPWYTGQYIYNVHDEGDGFTKKPENEWIFIDDHHPALLDKTRFDKMQIMLQRNRRGGHDYKTSRVRKHIHIFAGILKCAKCGSSMTASLAPRRADGWRPSVYGCSTRRKDDSLCSNKFVSDVTLGPFVFNFIANLIRAKDKTGPRTSAETIQRMILSGSSFKDVFSIEPLSLNELADLLRSGQTGVEYKPRSIFPDDNTKLHEKEVLTGRKRKAELALNRLRSLYLYSDSGMSEADYVIERKRISDELDSINARLSEIGADESSEISDDQEFLDKASYFIMVEQLLGDKEINYEKYIRSIEPEIPRNFILKIFSEIEVLDGKVSSLTFSNGTKVRFIYSS